MSSPCSPVLFSTLSTMSYITISASDLAASTDLYFVPIERETGGGGGKGELEKQKKKSTLNAKRVPSRSNFSSNIKSRHKSCRMSKYPLEEISRLNSAASIPSRFYLQKIDETNIFTRTKPERKKIGSESNAFRSQAIID